MSRAVTQNPAWIRAAIAVGNSFHYKKKKPFRHNAVNLLTLAALVGAVVVVLLAGGIVHPLLYVPAAALTFGLLFFTIIVLVSHEGAHGMFIVSKKARRSCFWNRLFGWSVSLFFAMHYVDDWERGHHEHHLHPIEATDDPFYAVLPLGRDLFRETLKMALIPAYLMLRARPAPTSNGPL